jgi:hypothetical protein
MGEIIPRRSTVSWTRIQKGRLPFGQTYDAAGTDGEHIHVRLPCGGASSQG